MTISAPVECGSSNGGARPNSASTAIQEQVWVLQAQEGDQDAFGRLVGHYDRRLLYYLTRFTKEPDQALDVAQEVWLTAWRRLRSLRSPGAFKAWLYRIAHDRVVNVIRRGNRRADVLDRWGEQQIAHTEDDDVNRMNAEAVHRALMLLTPEHREVLVLRFLESMSLDEISAALACSLGTVKSRLHYAKHALRTTIERNHE